MTTDAPHALTSSQTSAWRWCVCLLLMLATVINYMDRIALNQLSVRIMSAFDLNNDEYSKLESYFSFAFGTGALCVGFAVDRMSVRWVYPVMVLGWSLAGLVTGYVNSFAMLLACRFFLGLFEAGNWPCGIRTTRAILRPEERSLGNSLFQSGTALGAVFTPLLVPIILARADALGQADAWRIPFRVIGSLGFLWIALWFSIVPRRMLNTVCDGNSSNRAEGAIRFLDVFWDLRFWALVVLTVAINITWHGYRTWLPLYLQKQRGYSEVNMNWFMSAYYIVADIGSWTVGVLTLLLYRKGLSIQTTRLLALGFCAVLTSGSLVIPLLSTGWELVAGLLIVAFGALGLFPTYYSLTQEISSRHQGKVTGTLGAFAHFSQALFKRVEGRICDQTHSYEWVLGGAGLVPLLAFVVLLCLWRTRVKRAELSSRGA